MATAPSSPTLTLPSNGEYYDGFFGTPFQATYNSTDGADLNAYAFRIRTLPQGSTPGTAYQYWNGSGLQSTIHWNSASAAPGASFGFSYLTNLNGSPTRGPSPPRKPPAASRGRLRRTSHWLALRSPQ